MFSSFDTLPACEGRTDGHRTQHIRASIASHGNNNALCRKFHNLSFSIIRYTA